MFCSSSLHCIVLKSEHRHKISWNLLNGIVPAVHKQQMFTMKTWKERFPMESMLPDDLIGRFNKEETAVFRFASPSIGVQSELGAGGGLTGRPCLC
jgi:hypothetical protein